MNTGVVTVGFLPHKPNPRVSHRDFLESSPNAFQSPSQGSVPRPRGLCLLTVVHSRARGSQGLQTGGLGGPTLLLAGRSWSCGANPLPQAPCWPPCPAHSVHKHSYEGLRHIRYFRGSWREKIKPPAHFHGAYTSVGVRPRSVINTYNMSRMTSEHD